MTNRRNRSLALCALAALAVGGVASAQFESRNVELLSHLPLSAFPSNPSSGNDCWGYVSPSNREYALMGLRNAMAVVEITDPRNPVIIGSISHPSSLWGDYKVYRDVAYAVNEEGGNIQIIDLADVDNGNVTLVGTFGPSTSHNITIDEVNGYLYTSGHTYVYDLANPRSPVYVGRVTTAYQHDSHIVTYTDGPYAGRQILFGAAGGRGMDIYDVTDKSNMFRMSRSTYPGLRYCHQLWTSDDRQYIFINDELTSTPGTRIFDVSNLSNPVYIGMHNNGLPSSEHNLYYREGFIYLANYRSGLRVFDVSDPHNVFESGYFDTYPADNGRGFDGAWSNFPYFPSGTVIVSDMNRGLFVLDATAATRSLRFTLPDGMPDLVRPSGGTTVRVEVEASGGEPRPGTGMLHYDAGGGFVAVPMQIVGTNVYDAVFPSIACGATVRYYLTAETMDGHEMSYPGGAPVVSHTALAATGTFVAFEDDFETDKGWTVENIDLTDGAWERGVPIGGGERGDPPTAFGGSGQCYLTGNRPGNSDVDGGPTILTSPRFSMSGDGLLSYARWFYSVNGVPDEFIVEISNDDGQNWTPVEIVPHIGETWVFRDKIRISDYVVPSSEMRLRFIAIDNPNDSVTEAAVDVVTVLELECDSGVRLSVTGQCEVTGGGRIEWSDATPGSTLSLIFARNTGSVRVPPGNPCAGTTLGLGSQFIQEARRFNAGTGSGGFNATFPTGACGGFLQLLEFPACVTSNVEQIPN